MYVYRTLYSYFPLYVKKLIFLPKHGSTVFEVGPGVVLSFPGENVKCRVCLPHLKQEQLEIQLDLDLYMWKFNQNLLERNLTKWRRTCQLEVFHVPIASQCAHQEAKHGKLFQFPGRKIRSRKSSIPQFLQITLLKDLILFSHQMKIWSLFHQ